MSVCSATLGVYLFRQLGLVDWFEAITIANAIIFKGNYSVFRRCTSSKQGRAISKGDDSTTNFTSYYLFLLSLPLNVILDWVSGSCYIILSR